ncbi:MAG: caspase family protein [Anaerolineae bacterium]|nr:caspase family protein [Anaerolineae bacterium]
MGARKALLVAINNYPSQPLKGCINDSRQVEAALTQRFGFASSDIQILRERDATKANIEKGLEWLVSGAQDGDVLFFHYFTVHGSMPNRSNRVRKTVLVQMYAGDDQVEEGNMHPDEALVLRGWNSRMTRARANRAKVALA